MKVSFIDMRILTAMLLALVSCSSYAELFKWKDADGNIIYSDQPPPNINREETRLEEAELPPLIETPALKVPTTRSDSSNTEPGDLYESIEIVSPTGEEAVRENAGNVSISVAVKPKLLTQAGDLVVIYMDGKQVFKGQGFSVKLENVDRGDHEIKAEVVSAGGRVLKQAEPVTFTLQRFSALF